MKRWPIGLGLIALGLVIVGASLACPWGSSVRGNGGFFMQRMMSGHGMMHAPMMRSPAPAPGSSEREDSSPLSAQGAQLFSTLGCSSCHLPGGVGPSLEGLYGSRVRLSDGSVVLADEAYLRESILNPGAKIVWGYPASMPSYQGLIGEAELQALVAYLRTLSESEEEPLTTQR
ncbi:MAG: hypothetical protein KatS3mg115_0582 [Candidatus Poribacteria bacterium]|nr:MAG: hypothetical protein KatS3mg115_0582 [Candidatus Poribacteria bacterium]